MFNFRTVTVTFFLFLLTFNLLSLSGYPVPWHYYLLLIIVYLAVSVFASFLITSGFHMKALCRAETTAKTIALTFDDGPDHVTTPLVLDALRDNSLKATFFLIGRKIDGNEEILRRMIAEGHLIGTHSYSHSSWFDFFIPRMMKKEFLRTDEAIENVTGKKPLFFRPPYGVINPMLKKALKGTGYHVIGFSNRSFDTVITDRKKIVSRFSSNLKTGDIVVLHDTHPEMHLVVGEIARIIKERTFNVISLDELLQIKPYND